jgi:Spy/CpxP family protein refolding chaperone
MQTKNITRVIGGLGAAALIALGMAITVPHMTAAQGPGQPGPGRMGRGPGGMGRGGPGGPMALGIDPRDLTDAQREQIKAIRDRHADEIKPLIERAQNAHQALDNAVLTSTGDIRALAQDVGAAESELAFQQAQIETEVMSILTADQKQKIQDRRTQMAARRAEMLQRRQSQTQGNSSGNAK